MEQPLYIREMRGKPHQNRQERLAHNLAVNHTVHCEHSDSQWGGNSKHRASSFLRNEGLYSTSDTPLQRPAPERQALKTYGFEDQRGSGAYETYRAVAN